MNVTCAQCGETYDRELGGHLCGSDRESVPLRASELLQGVVESPLGLVELVARVTGLEDRLAYSSGFQAGIEARADNIESELRQLADRSSTLEATAHALRSDYATALRRIEALTGLVSDLERK